MNKMQKSLDYYWQWRKRTLDKMMEWCKDNSISVSYESNPKSEENLNADGLCYYSINPNDDLKDLKNYRIVIRKDSLSHEREFYVFAHEIGHILAISSNKDISEDAADKFGAEFLISICSNDDKENHHIKYAINRMRKTRLGKPL